MHGLASLELRGALGSPAEADAAWQSTMLAVITGLFGPAPRTRGAAKAVRAGSEAEHEAPK